MRIFESKKHLLDKIKTLESDLHFYKRQCDNLTKDCLYLRDQYTDLLKLIPDNGRDPQWPIDFSDEWKEKFLQDMVSNQGTC